jgi:GH24 family phage-related lysozyme (muramidase)
MRPIPDQAVDLVARWEGCRLAAYPDVATGGEPWTIGYGHTEGVRPGQLITQAQARSFLQVDLREAARKLYGVVKAEVIDHDLTDNQYAALLSLVFNVGAGRSWKIWSLLNARTFDQVHDQFGRFVNAGGRKLQGLVNRRADEARVWSIDEPGSANENPPSHVTRLMDTPPTPADPTPPSRSAALLTGALGVTATVPVAAKSVTDAVEPYRQAAPIVGQIIAIVATIAAAAAVLTLVLTWLKKLEGRR